MNHINKFNENTDCRTDIGVTVGLIDSIINISRILKGRLCEDKEVLSALSDLQDDEDLKYIINYKNEIS